MFALYTANTKALQAQAATATPVVRGLVGVLRSLALIGIITVGVDVIVKGMGTLMQANAELRKLRGERAAGGAATTFQGADRQTVLDAQKQARQTLQAIENERRQSRTPGARLQQLATGALGIVAPMVGLPSQEEMAARPALMKAREQKARDILTLPVPAAAKPPKPPQLLQPPTLDTGDISKKQQRAADAARRQAEAIAKGRLESEQLLERLEMQLAIEQEINPIKKIQLQNGLEQLEISQSYGNLIAEEEDGLRRNNLELAGALELQVANVRQTEDLRQKIEGAGNSMGKFLAEQMKVKKEATELDQAFQSIGSTISSGIIDAISAAVDGTKSLGDVANNVLRDIANTLLRFGLNTLTSSLAGDNGVGFFSKLFGGRRASGGTVRGGTSYLVGERGPELFTPNRSGSIAPNAAMGGSTIVVNVNSSGSQAQGGDQNAKQLGQAIGAAVQAELIRQKRPGGLLAS